MEYRVGSLPPEAYTLDLLARTRDLLARTLDLLARTRDLLARTRDLLAHDSMALDSRHCRLNRLEAW